jgi:hypothetical protein
VVAFAWTPLALASALAGHHSDITMSRRHISRIRTFFSQNGRKVARGAQLQVCIQCSLSLCTYSRPFEADKLSCSAFLRQPLVPSPPARLYGKASGRFKSHYTTTCAPARSLKLLRTLRTVLYLSSYLSSYLPGLASSLQRAFFNSLQYDIYTLASDTEQ